MIPKHLITTWITTRAGDRYTDAHRALFGRCLASWVRWMPDYRLTILTLDRVLDMDPPEYVRRWIKDEQFIGVSTWARLWYLQRAGGICLDMDVEAVAPFDDLLGGIFTVGHMPRPSSWANIAVMLAAPWHRMVREQMDGLATADPADPQFGNVIGPKLLTTVLKAHGWPGKDEVWQCDGMTVLPSTVFYPYHWQHTFDPACLRPETRAVHHWAKSWFARAGLEA